jgi:hypothetical protein
MEKFMADPERIPWHGSYHIRFLDGDYFGCALEFGIVGLAILILLFIQAFRLSAGGLREAREPACIVPYIGLGGCAAALMVQNVVSYPLRVPVTAAFFFIMIGYAGACEKYRTVTVQAVSHTLRALLSGATIIVLAALMLYSCWTLQGERLLVKAFQFACGGAWPAAAKLSARASHYPMVDPEMYNIYGDATTRLGRNNEAVTSFTMLLHYSPARSDTYDKLGTLFEKLGVVDRALFHYRRAVTLERFDTPEYRLHLARLLHALGNDDEARELLHEGMKIYPRDETLRDEFNGLDTFTINSVQNSTTQAPTRR